MTIAELDQLREAIRTGIQEGLSPLVAELRGINALFAAVNADEPPPTGCLHPAEQRVDFGLTNGMEDWQCGACGFRSVVEAHLQ